MTGFASEPSAQRERARAALYRALHECERLGFMRSICLRECADHLRDAGLPDYAERAADAAASRSDHDMLAFERELVSERG